MHQKKTMVVMEAWVEVVLLVALVVEVVDHMLQVQAAILMQTAVRVRVAVVLVLVAK